MPPARRLGERDTEREVRDHCRETLLLRFGGGARGTLGREQALALRPGFDRGAHVGEVRVHEVARAHGGHVQVRGAAEAPVVLLDRERDAVLEGPAVAGEVAVRRRVGVHGAERPPDQRLRPDAEEARRRRVDVDEGEVRDHAGGIALRTHEHGAVRRRVLHGAEARLALGERRGRARLVGQQPLDILPGAHLRRHLDGVLQDAGDPAVRTDQRLADQGIPPLVRCAAIVARQQHAVLGGDERLSRGIHQVEPRVDPLRLQLGERLARRAPDEAPAADDPFEPGVGEHEAVLRPLGHGDERRGLRERGLQLPTRRLHRLARRVRLGPRLLGVGPRRLALGEEPRPLGLRLAPGDLRAHVEQRHEDAAHLARLVAHRHEGERDRHVVRRRLGPAPPERVDLLGLRDRLTRPHAIVHRLGEVAHLGPARVRGLPEPLRMLAAEERDVAIVVELDELRPPEDDGGEAEGEHGRGRRAETLRPRLDGSERGGGPVVRAAARAQLAGAGEQLLCGDTVRARRHLPGASSRLPHTPPVLRPAPGPFRAPIVVVCRARTVDG